MEEKVSTHNIVSGFEKEVIGKGVEGESSFSGKAPHYLPASGLTINMTHQKFALCFRNVSKQKPTCIWTWGKSSNRTEKKNSSSKTVNKDVFDFSWFSQ